MRKLAIINSDSMDCSYGGVAPFMRNMHKGLCESFDVEYFLINDNLKSLKIPGRLKMIISLWTRRKDLKKCDFILSHVPEGSWYVGHLGIPYAHIFHGNSNPMTVSKWWFGKYFTAIFDYFYKYINNDCPLIYSVGPATGRVKKLFNPLEQNVKPIPYEQRHGLIFAGRLESVKNIDRLITIYSKIPNELRSNIPFYIAGYGTLEEKLKTLVHEMGLDNQVVFLGRIENKDMMKTDSSKQILIMASSTEGFPTAIAEAFSVGVPVVSTAVGDIPLVLKDGVNGYLFPLDFKDDDFVNAILNILNNYDHFAKAAYESSYLFNRDIVTKDLINDINSFLNARK